jgi:hypothetical protein
MTTPATPPFTTATITETHPLNGVRAGSSLARWDKRLIAAQDDAWDLAVIDPQSGAIAHFPLQGQGEHLEKPEKPDFEAMTIVDGHTLVLFGSGSTAKRRNVVLVDLHTRNVRIVDASPLYSAIMDRMGETPNIEGAACADQHLYLSHRGTGGYPNRWIVLPVWWLKNLDPSHPAPKPAMMGVTAIPTVAIHGVPLGVTDMTATEAGIIVLGAAEATSNAYDDGAVAGAAIGWCAEPGTPVYWTPIREADGTVTHHKPEGIVVDFDGGHAWVITDPDDGDQAALLLRLALT